MSSSQTSTTRRRKSVSSFADSVRYAHEAGQPRSVSRIRNRFAFFGIALLLVAVGGPWAYFYWFTSWSVSSFFVCLACTVVATWALPAGVRVCQAYVESRMRRDVSGKDNAACFECGYWLTEPSGRCSECGWPYESLDDVVEFWKHWQPCSYFGGKGKRKSTVAANSNDSPS